MIMKLLNDKNNFPRISIESTATSTDHRLGQMSTNYLTRETVKITVWTVRDLLCTVETTLDETIPVVTGNSVYDLVNVPISNISLVTGTLLGTPGTTFVNDTDYERNDEDGDGFWESIKWLGADEPDDPSDFYVSYNRKAANIELVRIIGQDIWSYIRQNWRTGWAEHIAFNPKLLSSVPVMFDEEIGVYRWELSIQFSLFDSTEEV